MLNIININSLLKWLILVEQSFKILRDEKSQIWCYYSQTLYSQIVPSSIKEDIIVIARVPCVRVEQNIFPNVMSDLFSR